eukprot:4241185-Pyramimonas_sp.AAC.1
MASEDQPGQAQPAAAPAAVPAAQPPPANARVAEPRLEAAGQRAPGTPVGHHFGRELQIEQGAEMT